MRFGIVLEKHFWGKGIGSLAIKKLVDQISSRFDVVRIYGEVITNNPASMRLRKWISLRDYFEEGHL